MKRLERYGQTNMLLSCEKVYFFPETFFWLEKDRMAPKNIAGTESLYFGVIS